MTREHVAEPERIEFLACPIALDGPALQSFPQPVAVLDENGLIVVANESFLAAPDLAAKGGKRVARALTAALGRLRERRNGVPIWFPSTDGQRVWEPFVLPLAQPGWRLVAVLDRTVPSRLQTALVASRARFKTLVAVASDCGWETAADGTFSMVTPRGLAGHPPSALIGQSAARLFDPMSAPPAISPFTAPVAVENASVWLVHANGGVCCVEVSAVPLYDRAGVWRGARGVCRDVTRQREQLRLQARQRHLERVFSRITSVFRQKGDPDEMVQMAASASTHGMGACGCQIFAADLHPEFPTRRVRLVPTASFGVVGTFVPVEEALERLGEDLATGVRRLTLDGMPVLLAPTVYSGRLVGAVLLWRRAGAAAWSDDEEHLLATLSGQIAAAIEQRAAYHLLLDVSRTDPLTGLMNRRAFYGELRRRFRRLQRDTRTGALVYLDLDNFKFVNDVYGHAKGDEALRHVADILRNNTRSTDLVARLGGDEFAVWLDGADEAVAVSRTQVFLVAGRVLQGYSGFPDRPLTLSLGVAIYDPKLAEDINAFISRADRAMYRAKRNGRGEFTVAPPPKSSGGRR